MTLKSSVLIIDSQAPSENSFGADVATQLGLPKGYSVIVIQLRLFPIPQVLEFIQKTIQDYPWTQFVVLGQHTTPSDLKHLTNAVPIFKILSVKNPFGQGADSQLLERTLLEGIAEYDLRRQNSQLLELFKDQNLKLKALSEDLEERVLKRQKFLETSKEKLIQANQNFKSLLSALFAIQRSTSIPEIENSLQKVLDVTHRLTWIRIFYKGQNALAEVEQLKVEQFAVFSTPLVLDNRELGKITFARSKNLPFSDEDTEFLTQISQAIALALDRLNQIERSQFLKQQWKSTFDAITDPVILIDQKYQIVDSNSSFDQIASGASKPYCYERLFGRAVPCENCHLGHEFKLMSAKVQSGQEVRFEVSSHLQGENIYVNVYRDVSDQNRVERQILESSKMAELGTIGGSIAHELNNPLAGLLTFVQLIKGDCKGNEPYFSDIVEMEKAALRCRDIIQNLLSFTRKSQESKPETVDLFALAEESLKIVNLRASSLGIPIHILKPESLIQISGVRNALTQALVNVLQNAIESVAENLKKTKGGRPEISIEISRLKNETRLDVIDNGLGLDEQAALKVFTPFFTTKDPTRHRGLGLSVAYQIIGEHGGNLSLEKTPEQKTRARFTFPSSF